MELLSIDEIYLKREMRGTGRKDILAGSIVMDNSRVDPSPSGIL
jgi:hypothetical protein